MNPPKELMLPPNHLSVFEQYFLYVSPDFLILPTCQCLCVSVCLYGNGCVQDKQGEDGSKHHLQDARTCAPLTPKCVVNVYILYSVSACSWV